MRQKPDFQGGPRFLYKTAAVLALLFAVLLAGSPAFIVVYLGLAVYVFRGPKETIQGLTIMALLLILNPGLFSKPSLASILRWLVLFAAFGRVLLDNKSKPLHIIQPILLFSSVILILSLIVSNNPAISILKMITFTVGTITIMTSFYRTLHLRTYWISWFLTISVLLFVLSLPLYGSRYGFYRNGVGFQGILNHPQVYGTIAAAFTAWLSGMYLFYHRNNRHLIALTALLGWIAVYTSLARTSMMMGAGGLGIAVLISFFLKPAWRVNIKQAVSVSFIFFFLLIAPIIGIIYGPQIAVSSQEFLLKGNTSESVEESFEGSRGFLIELQMENFRNAPITGIGFGVPSKSTSMEVKREGAIGVPVSASTEKGFMPSAVLEEMGITGAILTLVLLIGLIRPVYRYGDLPAMALMMACILVNFGEMVFFSLGGAGLFFWIMMGFAHNMAAGDHVNRLKQKQAAYTERSSVAPSARIRLPQDRMPS